MQIKMQAKFEREQQEARKKADEGVRAFPLCTAPGRGTLNQLTDVLVVS